MYLIEMKGMNLRMYYIIADTCVWMNMAKDINDKNLEKLIELVKQNKISILLPTIVRDEWTRNIKSEVITYAKDSYDKKVENVISLNKYLSLENKKKYKKLIDDIKVSKINYEKHINERIYIIESLFNFESTKNIDISETIKTKAVQLALNKEAPFHKKSSMGDALIIHSSVEYIKKHKIYPSFFVSENKDDYSEDNKKKHNEIHKDLKKYFDMYKIEYYTEIGKLLNKIENNTVSDENSNFIRRDIGTIEKLIDDINIKQITIEEERVFVYKINGDVEHYDNVYNKVNLREDLVIRNQSYCFRKCVDYFSHFKTTGEKGFKICNLDDMEALIFAKPLVSANRIDIYKKHKPITMSQCNLNNKIHKNFNLLLNEMIVGKKNILLLGLKTEGVDTIATAITSNFPRNFTISTIEDRSSINIMSGRHNVQKIVSDNNKDSILKGLNESENIESDAIIYDIGNYLGNNILGNILKVIRNKKGRIIVKSHNTSFLRNINEFFTLQLSEDYNEKDIRQDLINNLKYTIVISSCYEIGSYIREIWENDGEIWNKIAYYDVLKNEVCIKSSNLHSFCNENMILSSDNNELNLEGKSVASKVKKMFTRLLEE